MRICLHGLSHGSIFSWLVALRSSRRVNGEEMASAGERFDRVFRAVRRLVRPVPEIRSDILRPADKSIYVDGDANAGGPLHYLSVPRLSTDARLTSCLCTAETLSSDAFRYWLAQLGETWRLHRKLWEFGFICQALFERGLLQSGRRGLGFAVGQEPLPSLFAARGCEILATDLDTSDPRAKGWERSGEWAGAADALNFDTICDPALFRQRVRFRAVDMNRIPTDLTGFDFTWSACAFEHCGSIELGRQFLLRQMDCLKPGGVAVHTTEFNLSSNTSTVESGRTVIFRRRDIEELVNTLRDRGHRVEPLDLSLGTHPLDWYVDERPYSADRHLRKRQGGYAATSIGLIIQKSDG